MPIGGFVINVDPVQKQRVGITLQAIDEVEIHGDDGQGNLVAVIDTLTTDHMDQVVRGIHALAGVRSAGLVYFHAEDELDKIAAGEIRPDLSFGRRNEKS